MALAVLCGLAAPSPASSGGKSPTVDPVVDASASGREVEVGIRYDGVLEKVPVAADPLAGCSFHGPSSADEVRALLAVSVAARVARLDPEKEYAVVSCDIRRFDGAASAVWPIDDDPPPAVIEILTQAAVARLTIATPTPRTAPDGTETPFLVQLPVWFWLDPDDWRPQTATATLGPLGASATATASPHHTEWSAGDGSQTLTCPGPGLPWAADDPKAKSNCSHEYTATTPSDNPIDLTATAVYDLELSCVPARICSGVDLPTTLVATTSRGVYVTQARGVITG